MLKTTRKGRRRMSIEQHFKLVSKSLEELNRRIDEQNEEAAHLETMRRMAECRAGRAKYITREDLQKKIRQLMHKK